MIDIITYSDTNHKCLYDIFFESSYKKYLANDFNLINYYTNALNNDDTFQSNNWSSIIINRFNILIEYAKNNPNKWAIFSDIDIIFLDNIYDDISPLINKSHDIKIFYMSENIQSYKKTAKVKTNPYINSIKPQINGGFFLFLCCQEVYEWFTYIAKNITNMKYPNDQIFIQNTINRCSPFHIKFKDYDILYTVLNPLIFTTNNNPLHEAISALRFSKVFHATSASGIIEKMQVLSSIYCKKHPNSMSNLWA